MKKLIVTAVLTLVAFAAFAQKPYPGIKADNNKWEFNWSSEFPDYFDNKTSQWHTYNVTWWATIAATDIDQFQQKLVECAGVFTKWKQTMINNMVPKFNKGKAYMIPITASFHYISDGTEYTAQTNSIRIDFFYDTENSYMELKFANADEDSWFEGWRFDSDAEMIRFANMIAANK